MVVGNISFTLSKVRVVSDAPLSDYVARNLHIKITSYYTSVSPTEERITLDAGMGAFPFVRRIVSLSYLGRNQQHIMEWDVPRVLRVGDEAKAELSLIPEGATTGRYIAEKRYRADVVVQGSATPAEIISQIELASDSDYLKVDGSWALDIPTSEADSGIELVDEMLASRATLIAGENLSSRFTSIAAAYIAPNENWKRVFTPEYESSTLLSKEGRALPRQDIACRCGDFPNAGVAASPSPSVSGGNAGADKHRGVPRSA